MAVVEAPISTSVDTMIGLRPMRSPKCEEHPANRARGESHCEHTEDGNRAGERAQRGKEQRVESERREKSVHEEVVPLDGRAEEARHEHPAVGRADDGNAGALDIGPRYGCFNRDVTPHGPTTAEHYVLTSTSTTIGTDDWSALLSAGARSCGRSIRTPVHPSALASPTKSMPGSFVPTSRLMVKCDEDSASTA